MVDIMLTMTGDEINKLIFIGGKFSEGKDGFVGALANREISNYRFDKAFMGVAGVNAQKNIVTTYTLDDATTKETVLKCSKQSYLLLETRKLDKDGNYVYSSINNFVGAIIEQPLDDEKQKIFSAYDLKFI